MGLLPNAEIAVVPLEKLRDYSLDSFHPAGKHKARVFRAALGMTQNDAPRLRAMILQAILVNDAVDQGANVHGNRYSVDFQTIGIPAEVTIRTAWIIDRGENVPRLTSCYVLR
jgi:hypothetical protein